MNTIDVLDSAVIISGHHLAFPLGIKVEPTATAG